MNEDIFCTACEHGAFASIVDYQNQSITEIMWN